MKSKKKPKLFTLKCPDCGYVDSIVKVTDKVGWCCDSCEGGYGINYKGEIKPYLLTDKIGVTKSDKSGYRDIFGRRNIVRIYP